MVYGQKRFFILINKAEDERKSLTATTQNRVLRGRSKTELSTIRIPTRKLIIILSWDGN